MRDIAGPCYRIVRALHRRIGHVVRHHHLGLPLPHVVEIACAPPAGAWRAALAGAPLLLLPAPVAPLLAAPPAAYGWFGGWSPGWLALAPEGEAFQMPLPSGPDLPPAAIPKPGAGPLVPPGTITGQPPPIPTPEPSSLALLAFPLALILCILHRRCGRA